MSYETCEMEDCGLPAACIVKAQWTIVDFVGYRMCDEHWPEAVSGLERRKVDGQLPVDVWVEWWHLS